MQTKASCGLLSLKFAQNQTGIFPLSEVGASGKTFLGSVSIPDPCRCSVGRFSGLDMSEDLQPLDM